MDTVLVVSDKEWKNDRNQDLTSYYFSYLFIEENNLI